MEERERNDPTQDANQAKALKAVRDEMRPEDLDTTTSAFKDWSLAIGIFVVCVGVFFALKHEQRCAAYETFLNVDEPDETKWECKARGSDCDCWQPNVGHSLHSPF